MRYLILALMIALLPLRGWAGNSMAIQMAVQPAHQSAVEPLAMSDQPDRAVTKTVAASALPEWAGGSSRSQTPSPVMAGMSPDCLEHMSGKSSGTADTAADPANADCGDCAACQMCHTVALTGLASILLPAFEVSLSPQPAATPFASADAAQGQKPPIS